MVKFYFIFLATILSLNKAFAQEQSVDEYSGNWTSNGSWQDGTAPPTVSISDDIVINGTITAPSLNFKTTNLDLTVSDYDTLVVVGNLIMNRNNSLSIGNGAVLVVLGELSAKRDFITFNTGTILVTGEVNVDDPTTIVNGGELYFLGGNNLTDDDFNPGTVESNVDNQDDLNNNDPDLVTFLDTNYGTTLPVELIYFEAIGDREWVRLAWATATETNNDYFIIERAKGDLKFQEIGTVEGNGTTNEPTEYQAEDQNPPNGQLYYRLKQVDFDGSEHYHRAATINVVNNPVLSVYPNPSSDGTVKFAADSNVQEVVYISTLGNRYLGVITNGEGSIIISPVQPLAIGMYLVRIQTEHQIYFADVLIQ